MLSCRKTNYASDPTTLDIGALDVGTIDHQRPEIRTPTQEKREPAKRVLLLDDMVDLRDVIAEYLASYSFHVTAVSNGAEGLREFLKDPFDLIVCDMMMPQLNGEMFYWAVTRMRPAAGQRFIFLTGHQNRPTIQSFFQRINAVVLFKPFKLDGLRTVMQDVLKKLR